MDDSPLKRENQNGIREHAAALADAAGDALASTDAAEGWNAAFAYAKDHSLPFGTMTAVLSILKRQRRISARLLTDWLREGRDALSEVRVPDPDQLTNRQLEGHALSTRWEHKDHLHEIYLWADRFNDQFFDGKLPAPAISIARARPSVLGSYTLNRDGLGLKYRININAIHLQRGLPDVLTTLLHEMLHEWEEVENGRKRGGPYHTTAFREKALELGIPTDARGRSLGIAADSPFARLLRVLNVEPQGVVAEDLTKKPAPRNRPTLQKWSCGCTNLWSSRATDVRGLCERCGQRWSRVAVPR